MQEAISILPTAPQGKGKTTSRWANVGLDHLEKTAGILKGKGKATSPWVNVSPDHLVKTADSLKKYAEKKKAEEAAKKKK